MTFNKKEIDIIKNAIKEYEYLETNIHHAIKEGNNIKLMLDYLVDNFDVDIANCDFKSDYKYIDFNYGTLSCSILESSEMPTTFSKYISVWNDEDFYTIVDFIDIDELKKLIMEDETNESRNNSNL